LRIAVPAVETPQIVGRLVLGRGPELQHAAEVEFEFPRIGQRTAADADADEALSIQIAQTFIRPPPVEAFAVRGSGGNRDLPVAILYEEIPVTYDSDVPTPKKPPNSL
jgi:hypothetical protein